MRIEAAGKLWRLVEAFEQNTISKNYAKLKLSQKPDDRQLMIDKWSRFDQRSLDAHRRAMVSWAVGRVL